ncbi:MAG: hypothetical protein ACRCY4_08820 [Brevinema sp.]
MKGIFIIFCILFSSCSVTSITLDDYLISIRDGSIDPGDVTFISIDVVAIDGSTFKSEDGTLILDAGASRRFQNRNTVATYTYMGPRFSEGIGRDYVYTRNGRYYGIRIYTPIQIGFFLVAQDRITDIPWDTTDPAQIVVLLKE